MHIGPQQKADSAHRTPIVHLSLNHKITNKRIKALCALQFMMPVSVICPLMHYKVYILSCLKAVFKQSIQRVFQLRLKRIQRKSYQQSLKYVLVGLSILRKYFYRNLSRLCNISKFPWTISAYSINPHLDVTQPHPALNKSQVKSYFFKNTTTRSTRNPQYQIK